MSEPQQGDLAYVWSEIRKVMDAEKAETIERCAKVAETFPLKDAHMGTYIAAAIRALKDSP